jgi:spermidine/putrescine transport system substrate-binding protein
MAWGDALPQAFYHHFFLSLNFILEKEIMTRLFRSWLLWVLFALVISAISGNVFFAQDTDSERLSRITWECPDELRGQRLNVYNWSDYIADATIPDFETLCDASVTLDFYDTNEGLLTRLRQGNPGYDIAFPNDYMVAVLISENLIQPLNLDHIPNIANVGAEWRGMYFDPDNAYSVPYLWSNFGVGYRVDKVPEGITSWQDVFAHVGAVDWIADQRAMFPIALRLLGKDPNSLDIADIQTAKQYLLANSDNVVSIGEGYSDPLVTGEADIVLTYNAEMYNLALTCECDDYAYVVPSEGSIVDVTNAVILQDAPNPRLAEAFIDYLNDPFVAAQITNAIAYPTTNQAAIDSGFIDEALLNDPAVFLNEAQLATLFFLQPVTEAEQAYNDAWDELRIEMGN